MCLRASQTKTKIADKNVTCYKLIAKNMTSLFHTDFKWEFGKLYETEMQFYKSVEYGIVSTKITQAFHSYKSYKDVKGAYLMCVHPCMIVECTIPEGATFYEGYHGTEEGFASNQLIINKVIDNKEIFTDFDWNKYPYREGQTITVSWCDGQHKTTCRIENIQPQEDNGEYISIWLICTQGHLYNTNIVGENPENRYTIEIIKQPNKED